jgi:hypothetical protein
MSYLINTSGIPKLELLKSIWYNSLADPFFEHHFDSVQAHIELEKNNYYIKSIFGRQIDIDFNKNEQYNKFLQIGSLADVVFNLRKYYPVQNQYNWVFPAPQLNTLDNSFNKFYQEMTKLTREFPNFISTAFNKPEKSGKFVINKVEEDDNDEELTRPSRLPTIYTSSPAPS